MSKKPEKPDSVKKPEDVKKPDRMAPGVPNYRRWIEWVSNR